MIEVIINDHSKIVYTGNRYILFVNNHYVFLNDINIPFSKETESFQKIIKRKVKLEKLLS